jgi:hypothetical protein
LHRLDGIDGRKLDMLGRGATESCPMLTATEFRRQSVLYMDEAKEENRTGIRTSLLALHRTCVTMAEQIDRLAVHREEEREP